MGKINWKKILYVIGIVLFIVGSIDPLEGSVLILAGCIFFSTSIYLAKGQYYKVFIITALMISIGVFFLFYLSSLGGFGGESELSWWWCLLILPYPVGWFVIVVLLIKKAINKRRNRLLE
jgi:hypothetical protein